MIRLRTLGAVDLKDSEGRELRPLLTQPKRVALLTYLALAGSSGFRRRDTVVALFWPELDEEHARGSLRQALRFLRRSLGEGIIVSRGEEEIGVDRGVLMMPSPSERRRKRSEEHTSELQSRSDLVCRLLLEKKKRSRTYASPRA